MKRFVHLLLDIETAKALIRTTTIKSSQRWPTSFLHQLRMLTWRGFIQSKGNVLNRFALAEMSTVSVLIALGSFRKGIGYKQSHDVMGMVSNDCFKRVVCSYSTFPAHS